MNNKYIKIRNIKEKYYACYLFNDKILYNPYNGYIDKRLSNRQLNKVKEDIKKAIDLHNYINKEA